MSCGKNVPHLSIHIPSAAVQNDEDCLLQQSVYDFWSADNRTGLCKQELSQCRVQSLSALRAGIHFIQEDGEILLFRVLLRFQANESNETIKVKIGEASTTKDASA